MLAASDLFIYNTFSKTHFHNENDLHHEPTLILAPRLQDINSLYGHLFQARLVSRVGSITGRTILLAFEIISQDL
jgi:hypothetical protein